MSILLFTGAGIGLGSLLGFLIERRPHVLASSNSMEVNQAFSVISFLFVIGLGLNFYGLSVAGFPIPEIICLGFFLATVWTAAFFDINYRLIPNRIIIAGIAGWLSFTVLEIIPFYPSVLAGICSAALVLLIRLAGFLFYQKAGMGIGDVKLVFLLGLFLQWEVFWVIYLAVLAGGTWAIGGIVSKKLDRKSRLPFGPFLWIAASIAVFIPFSQFVSLWV